MGRDIKLFAGWTSTGKVSWQQTSDRYRDSQRERASFGYSLVAEKSGWCLWDRANAVKMRKE